MTPNGAQQDFVLLRSDGVPLYNFGAVVDDATMGVTLVARGRDHMVNTPPQIMIYEALGQPPPDFAHLPMMLAQSGEKLSKRHGAVSVMEYRDQGYSPRAVLNYLARFGWSHGDQEVFSLEELAGAFDWEHCNRSDGKFDAKKFLAINHEHLKTPRLTGDPEYAAANVAVSRGARARRSARPRGAGRPAHPRAGDHVRRRRRSARLRVSAIRLPSTLAAAAKLLVPASAPLLRDLAAAIENVEPWSAAALEAAVNAWLPGTGLPMKDVAQPARVALTGRAASPGLFDVIAVLGRARALARLRTAADTIRPR